MSSPMQKSICLFIYYIYMARPFGRTWRRAHEPDNVSLNAHMAGLFDHQDAQTWSIEHVGEGYQVAVRGSED